MTYVQKHGASTMTTSRLWQAFRKQIAGLGGPPGQGFGTISLHHHYPDAETYGCVSPARAVLSEEDGSSVLELALLTSLLLLLLVGAVDMGQAFYAAIEVSAAANAGAQFGVQNPTSTSGMQQAALLDAPNLTGLSATASWGCECSDGSSSSTSCASTPSCGSNAVGYVLVTTSTTYVPMLRFPGVPSSLVLKGSARLRTGQ